MNIIKYSALSFMAILLITSSSCQQSANVQEMLHDEDERQQVYSAILEDEQMRNELMANMRDQNMGAGMMRGGMVQGEMIGDTSGMVNLHRQQVQQHMKQLMTLCDSDTVACNEMARFLLQHPGMMENVVERMHQQGMIDTTQLNQVRRHLNR